MKRLRSTINNYHQYNYIQLSNPTKTVTNSLQLLSSTIYPSKILIRILIAKLPKPHLPLSTTLLIPRYYSLARDHEEIVRISNPFLRSPLLPSPFNSPPSMTYSRAIRYEEARTSSENVGINGTPARALISDVTQG